MEELNPIWYKPDLFLFYAGFYVYKFWSFFSFYITVLTLLFITITLYVFSPYFFIFYIRFCLSISFNFSSYFYFTSLFSNKVAHRFLLYFLSGYSKGPFLLFLKYSYRIFRYDCSCFSISLTLMKDSFVYYGLLY